MVWCRGLVRRRASFSRSSSLVALWLVAGRGVASRSIVVHRRVGGVGGDVRW
ncbi:hypothetical protein ACXZ9C_10725 [Streptococcus agalactiae]